MMKMWAPLGAILLAATFAIESQADASVCMAQCGGEVTFHMTPFWFEEHASYINSDRSTSAAQITFNTGSVANGALLKVPLIQPGVLTDGTPLSVEITIANDISIGNTADSDIRYGVSDGNNFVGFEAPDKGNYENHSPCIGIEGVSGATLSSIRRDPIIPKPSDSFYPAQFAFTLKLDALWGSCYTMHDGGFIRTAVYNNRLMVSKGITLEVYKTEQRERVGIRFIRVTVTKDS